MKIISKVFADNVEDKCYAITVQLIKILPIKVGYNKFLKNKFIIYLFII